MNKKFVRIILYTLAALFSAGTQIAVMVILGRKSGLLLAAYFAVGVVLWLIHMALLYKNTKFRNWSLDLGFKLLAWLMPEETTTSAEMSSEAVDTVLENAATATDAADNNA